VPWRPVVLAGRETVSPWPPATSLQHPVSLCRPPPVVAPSVANCDGCVKTGGGCVNCDAASSSACCGVPFTVAKTSSTRNSSQTSWSSAPVSKPPGWAWNWNRGGVDGEGISVAGSWSGGGGSCCCRGQTVGIGGGRPVRLDYSIITNPKQLCPLVENKVYWKYLRWVQQTAAARRPAGPVPVGGAVPSEPRTPRQR
jgi:hypothetical protein